MPKTQPSTRPTDRPERIAKRLARAGLCSRREAERWIAQGRVAVDGAVIRTPAVNVMPESRIAVDGKPIPAPEPARLWRYHKPRGLLTATRDPQGRPTLFETLPPDLPRVIAVGRLDLNSEGLLLLTNDGDLARRLELPDNAWVRRYRVRVHGRVEAATLEALAKGLTVDGILYGPIRATLDRQQNENAWLTMSLAEGRNREIRRVCRHLGWPVSRLIRIAFGPFQLGLLAAGAVEEVPRKVLREQLGQPTGAARRKRAPRDKGARHADRRRPA